MKKLLLIAACNLCLAGVQAQTAEQPKWSNNLSMAVLEADELNLSAPAAVDNAGNVYATGSFTLPIAIGNVAYFEPIANSAYLAKYNAEGTALWAVALRGAATISSITTDAQNNVYVAGTLAGTVIVGSTDDKNVTLNGKDGVLDEVSSFIAAYNADGVLKATKVMWTQQNAEVAATGMNEEAYASVKINHLAIAGDKLYASALYTGDLTVDGLDWDGAYNMLDFGGGLCFYTEITSGGVFSVSAATLENAAPVAHIGATKLMSGTMPSVESISCTTDGETLYLCFIGTDTLTYTKADGSSEEYQFEYAPDAIGRGYVVSSVKDGVVNSKLFTTTSYTEASYSVLGDMKVEGNVLYVSGMFQNACPFNNELVAQDACDVFAAALDKASLEPQWVAQSGLAEGNGDINNNEELMAMTVNNGEVTLYGYVYHTKSGEEGITSTFAYNCANGTATASEAPFVTDAAINGTTKVLLTADQDKLETGIEVYTVPASTVGVESVKAMSAQRVGDTFYFAEPKDITVYDLQGRALQQEYAATSVSLENLSQGIYILTDGKQSLKVLK